jgi:predicted RNase H-like HicB family nuclease
MYNMDVYEDKDYYIARCKELPIIIRGNSDEELLSKMKLAIKEFHEVFPNRRESRKIKKVLTLDAN